MHNLIIFFQEMKTCNYSILMDTTFPLPARFPETKTWFAKFKELGNSSNTTNYNWTQIYEGIRLWETETETKRSVTTYPGSSLEVYQVVGSCGSTIVRTDRISVIHRVPTDLDKCIPKDGYQLIFVCDAFNDEVSTLFDVYKLRFFYECQAEHKQKSFRINIGYQTC